MSIFFVIIIALTVIGGVSGIVHLINSNQKKLDTKISNRRVVELAERNYGVLTVSLLSQLTDLTISESRAKLYAMLNSGIFNYQMNAEMQEEFKLSKTIRDALKDNQQPNAYTNNYHKNINDSEVIKLAASAGGKLTAAYLCMKSGISVDKAKELLEELQSKGVFDIQVTDNGAIVYELIDMDLLKG